MRSDALRAMAQKSTCLFLVKQCVTETFAVVSEECTAFNFMTEELTKQATRCKQKEECLCLLVASLAYFCPED